MPTPLLATKLTDPPPEQGLVPGPQLIEWPNPALVVGDDSLSRTDTCVRPGWLWLGDVGKSHPATRALI